MRKAFEAICLLIGGLAVAAGAGLLFFTRFGTMFLIAGICMLFAGILVFSLARPGRTWAARSVLAVLALGTLALCQTAPHWLPYVSAEERAAPPSIDEPDGDRPVLQLAGGQAGKKKGTTGPDEKEQTLTLEELLRDHIEPALKSVSAKKDYVCTFHKREWARGLVGGYRLTNDVCYMKVRHDPFSAYLYFEQPSGKRGTEALYVEGKNGGNVIAHGVGIERLVGTIRVPPSDAKVMKDNRYPITNIGMKNLLLKIKNNAKEFEEELKGFALTIVEDKKIDERPCKVIDFFNPKPTDKVPMTSLRIYIDREWNVPTGFEAYERRDGTSQIAEYYRYTNLKFDTGLKDIDFDPANPEYGYR
jgi:hypothetical protein